MSCHDSREPDRVNNLNKITHLFCQASQLKNDRFILADSVRLIQDSIIHHTTATNERLPLWNEEIIRMEKRSNILADKSRNLGDSIRQVLRQLTIEMTPQEKRIFNDSLQAKTERLNCD